MDLCNMAQFYFIFRKIFEEVFCAARTVLK
jgi:hypothetical protein